MPKTSNRKTRRLEPPSHYRTKSTAATTKTGSKRNRGVTTTMTYEWEAILADADLMVEGVIKRTMERLHVTRQEATELVNSRLFHPEEEEDEGDDEEDVSLSPCFSRVCYSSSTRFSVPAGACVLRVPSPF